MITVRFTLTRRELATVARGRVMRDRRGWFWSAAVLVACLAGVVALDPSHWVPLTVTVVVVYAVVGRLAMFGGGFVVPFWWCRNQAWLRHEQTFRLTDAGVQVQALDFSRQTSWDFWSKLESFPSAYVLVYPTGWLLIPKRAFASPEDDLAFVELARRQLRAAPDRARRTERGPSNRGEHFTDAKQLLAVACTQALATN